MLVTPYISNTLNPAQKSSKLKLPSLASIVYSVFPSNIHLYIYSETSKCTFWGSYFIEDHKHNMTFRYIIPKLNENQRSLVGLRG